MLEIIKSTLTDNAILGAIFSSVSIILLGFYLRKKETLSSSASKMLTKVVLSVSIPALAFTSFMKDINNEQLKEFMGILVWGVAIYILLIPITKIMFAKVKGDKQDVYRILTIFGSTTFFSTPIVSAAYAIRYDREALFTSNCSLLSTVVAVAAMPVWIVVLEVIKNIGLFT